MVGKLKDVIGVPIASTQAGAYMRPSWYNLSFEGRDMTQVLLNNTSKTLYEDALKLIFHEQELAGLDIFTDGALRYDDWVGSGWVNHLLARLGGVKWTNEFVQPAFTPVPGMITVPIPQFLQETQLSKPVEVVEKLNRGNLQFGQFYKFAARFTDRPLRYTMPEAAMTMIQLRNNHGVYKDNTEMYFDLCKLINAELKILVDAGCKIIQLDYPFAPAFQAVSAPEEIWRLRVDGFNTEVQGVNAQIWVHLDWGKTWRGQIGSFESLFRYIGDAKVDVVGIEAASTYGNNLDRELAIWKEYCSNMDICLGVVNHRRTQVETPEEVAGIIRKALKYVPPEKLAAYSDCGLNYVPRVVAYGKIKAIVVGCKLVRKELGISN